MSWRDGALTPLSVVAVVLAGGALLIFGDPREGAGVFLGAAVVAAAEQVALLIRNYLGRSPRQ